MQETTPEDLQTTERRTNQKDEPDNRARDCRKKLPFEPKTLQSGRPQNGGFLAVCLKTTEQWVLKEGTHPNQVLEFQIVRNIKVTSSKVTKRSCWTKSTPPVEMHEA